MGCKVGLAINPETSTDILKDYLMDIDLVLFDERKSRLWWTEIYS